MGPYGRLSTYSSMLDWVKALVVLLFRRVPGFRSSHRLVLSVRTRNAPAPALARVGSTDLYVAYEVWEEREYQEALEMTGGSGGEGVILDLGANVGYTCLYWAQHLPESKIVAVEPDPSNFNVLIQNCSRLVAGSKLHPIQAGCGASRGRVNLERGDGEWTLRISSTSQEGEIPRLRVEDILSRSPWQLPISLLKCDIEGAEREIFGNCADWIGRVKALVVETHPPYTAELLLQDLVRSKWHPTRHKISRKAGQLELLLATGRV